MPGSNLVSRSFASLALVALALAVSGCSPEEEYENKPKAPAVATISVLIIETSIAASPTELGAGPTRFVVGNKSDVAQTVTIDGERVGEEFKLGAGETRTFKVNTYPGPLTLDASSTTGDAAEIEIGPERPSAQNDITQP